MGNPENTSRPLNFGISGHDLLLLMRLSLDLVVDLGSQLLDQIIGFHTHNLSESHTAGLSLHYIFGISSSHLTAHLHPEFSRLLILLVTSCQGGEPKLA